MATRAAAELLADDPLADVLRQLADERRELAGRVGERLRELDDLPPEPDADLEAVRELATWVKAALTGDQRHTVLLERKAAEAHLEAIGRGGARPARPRPRDPCPARADPRRRPCRAATPRGSCRGRRVTGAAMRGADGSVRSAFTFPPWIMT